MSCMISDASEEATKTQVKHAGGEERTNDELGWFDERTSFCEGLVAPGLNAGKELPALHAEDEHRDQKWDSGDTLSK